MRTTLSIDDELLAAAKETARGRGYTLGQLVEDALRRELVASHAAGSPPVPVFRGGTGAQPGIPLRSNRALIELLETSDSNRQQ
jgi:hypothetical protein